RHVRRPRSAVAPPLRARRLLGERPDHGERPRRQERAPHRRVRQGRVRAGHAARRRRARRRPCASARPLHDLVRVHPGLRAVVDRRRCRRGGTPDPRHRRDRRYADRHPDRQSLHLGERLCQCALPPRAGEGSASGRGARPHQRGDERHGVGRWETAMTRSTSQQIVSGVVAAALLGGCAIGPDYKRPAVAEPPTFRGQAAAEAVSFADAPWWEAFQDPNLKALIQEALARNYDVAIAAARVQEARASLSVARSDLYPSLDYGASVSRSKISPGIAGSPGGPALRASNFYSATMSASWELDIWGRIRRSNEAARATLFATGDARRGVWLTLVSDLAQAYFELLALDVRLQIARNSTDAYQRTYDLFLDRFN